MMIDWIERPWDIGELYPGYCVRFKMDNNKVDVYFFQKYLE